MPQGHVPWNYKDWGELAGSPTETLSFDGGGAVSKYIGPYNQRWSYARMLYAPGRTYYQQVTDDPGASGIGDFICRNVSMAPFKGEQQGADQWVPGIGLLATYERAILIVQWGSQKINDPFQDPLNPNLQISESIATISEYTRLDPDYFEWGDGASLRDEEAPGRFHQQLEYTLTRHAIDIINPLSYTLVDHINDSVLRPNHPSLGNREFEEETVLYLGCSVSRAASFRSSDIKQTNTLKFRIKRGINPNGDVHGHNSQWRANTQKWERMMVKPDSGSPVDYAGHPKADLTVL